MTKLKALCAELGFSRIETYIASGNVVFDCDMASAKVQAQVENRLLAYAGKAVRVFARTAAEMRTILNRNPFSDKERRHTHALLPHEKPPTDALDDVRGRAGEEMRLGHREIYVYYPSGMGQSKLQIPAARLGTAILATDTPLPEKNVDHPLRGEWKAFRDFHVKPDLVSIYRKIANDTLQLVRLGSHSEPGF